jgi:hypothetical protein
MADFAGSKSGYMGLMAKFEIGLNWLFAERIMVRLWRHADIANVGGNFNEYTIFYLQRACHDFDFWPIR